MPSLDYKTAVHVLGDYVITGPRFYDGTEGHQAITCPVCRRPADALFGDHGNEPGCLRLGREHAALQQELERKRNRKAKH